MRILITGARGMLGRTLEQTFQAHELSLLTRVEADLADARATREAILARRPELVIHAAAFTAVDRAESEPDAAFQANAVGSANVAMASHAAGARLIAISTDYVFDGGSDRPYHEWDLPNPQSVYGQSKWAGEEAIRAHCPNHVIARVAWLYGAGGPSFLHTMLRLGQQGGDPLKVVVDQFGNPTSTDAVADKLLELLEIPVVGCFHLSCEGETTWNGFTQAIFKAKGFSRGVEACSSEAFPRPAPRPKNSRLEKRALRLNGLSPMPHWQEALEAFLKAHPDA